MDQKRYFHREVSWLAFNHRVLQEAMDTSIPLYERLKFLAIYSNNLDEFFRVRVATLGSYKKLDEETQKFTGGDPGKLLKQIRLITHAQQEEFGRVFRNDILPALQQVGVELLVEDQFTEEDMAFANSYFRKNASPYLRSAIFSSRDEAPFLENKALYFVVGFEDRPDTYGLINIPVGKLPRFIRLPSGDGRLRYTFLDEIIRNNLEQLFPDLSGAYAVKLSRDADLGIEDEFSGDLLEQIRTGLRERKIGLPTRLLYDSSMPSWFLKLIRAVFNLKKNELIPGGRHHNFNDFFGFPNDTGIADLHYKPLEPLDHPGIKASRSIMQSVWEKDRLLHFPYQKFDYIPALLQEAAEHQEVEQIRITLYRVAKDSAVVKALLLALEKGKQVTAFIEVKARFDEAHNLHWGEQLHAAGANVIYSYPGIKVHAKVLHIGFRDGQEKDIIYLSTGNFNEKTSKIYSDFGLLTANPAFTSDIDKVFQLLDRKLLIPKTQQLTIAPYKMKEMILRLIDREIEHARNGEEAYLIWKLNNLEDREIIDKLYEASREGVQQFLIVRSICCLKPGAQGLSDNIKAVSIVDRYLEHGRVYIFSNGGNEEMYMGSADIMTRNLEHRIEVIFPVLDKDVYKELRHVISIQMRDNEKARWIDSLLSNPYRQALPGVEQIRSQHATYAFLKGKLAEIEQVDAKE